MADPGVTDLTCFQGAQFVQRLEWKDDQDPPQPIDLTGYTARMQVRRLRNSDEILLELTTADGRITLGDPTPTDGVIILEIDATDTAALPATPSDRKWRYDLELIPGGDPEAVRRLLMGKFIVDLEVTR